MQQAVPFKTWIPPPTTTTTTTTGRPPLTEADTAATTSTSTSSSTSVEKLVSENAVIVFGPRGCCMCHVVKSLLLGHGVNPTVFEVDDQDEADVMEGLSEIAGGKDGRPKFPAVFVGGKLFGGLERVMATHISGELVPILKEAGALWL